MYEVFHSFSAMGFPAEARSVPQGNMFWKSSAWKRGVIRDIRMCPRQEMYKEHVSTAPLSMHAAFTDAQEIKQASCIFLPKSFLNFHTASSLSKALLVKLTLERICSVYEHLLLKPRVKGRTCFQKTRKSIQQFVTL